MIGEKIKYTPYSSGDAELISATIIDKYISNGKYFNYLVADEEGNVKSIEASRVKQIDMNNPFSNIFGRRKKKPETYGFQSSFTGQKHQPQQDPTESIIPLMSLGNFSDMPYGPIESNNHSDNSDSFGGFGGGDTGGGGASGSWDSGSSDSGSSDSGSSDSGSSSSD